MTEETEKQMTWHKEGKRYRPENMIHPADGESWKHFDSIHPEKAADSRNVLVALATDGRCEGGAHACCVRTNSSHNV